MKLNSWQLTKIFIQYLKPYLGKELLVLLLLVIGSVSALVTPYLLKIIIDDIFPNGEYRDLVNILLFLLGVYVVRITVMILTDILYTKISRSIVSDIRADMVSNLLNRSILFFKKANSGELVWKHTDDIENIQRAISSLILNFLNNTLTIIGILIMLGFLDVQLTLLSLLILPLIFLSIKKFTPIIQKSFEKIQNNQGELNNYLLEKIRNIRVVKSYGSYAYELSKLRTLQDKIISLYTINARLSSFNKNIVTFLVATGPIIVLAVGGSKVFSGVMTLGSLIAFMQYLNKLFSPTINIMDSYTQFNNAIVSMRRVLEFLTPLQNKGDSILNIDVRQIDFKSVGLQIGKSQILFDINLTFESGKVYGIKGASGSGKSSLLNLICGFINPSSGKIFVNNEHSIKNLKNWEENIGLIEKENQLFSDSIINNIKYGNFGRTDVEVLEAIELASLSSVIDNLDNHGEADVNETGTMLSDGQKQRVSIARAILKKPKIILLDEATSSLDSKLETFIIDNIKRHCKESIIIIVTHNPSSIRKCDIVFEIKNKKILRSSDVLTAKETR